MWVVNRWGGFCFFSLPAIRCQRKSNKDELCSPRGSNSVTVLREGASIRRRLPVNGHTSRGPFLPSSLRTLSVRSFPSERYRCLPGALPVTVVPSGVGVLPSKRGNGHPLGRGLYPCSQLRLLWREKEADYSGECVARAVETAAVPLSLRRQPRVRKSRKLNFRNRDFRILKFGRCNLGCTSPPNPMEIAITISAL